MLHAPEVNLFRDAILAGDWNKVLHPLVMLANYLSQALKLLPSLAFDESDNLAEAKFLIHRQKFLELVEAQKMQDALLCLRTDLALLKRNDKRLHSLASYVISHVDRRK